MEQDLIKYGDSVVLGCHPSKSKKPVCAVQKLTLNGKAMPLGGGPGARRRMVSAVRQEET